MLGIAYLHVVHTVIKYRLSRGEGYSGDSPYPGIMLVRSPRSMQTGQASGLPNQLSTHALDVNVVIQMDMSHKAVNILLVYDHSRF